MLHVSNGVIWIVGSPRSGTSYITDLIGNYTNFCFNEPWETYPLGKHNSWDLPNNGRIVFKYCANALHYEEISNRFPISKWIHVTRDPFHVLYSMCFPKKGSWPKRLWNEMGEDIDRRVCNAFYKWSYTRGAANLIDEALIVKYEKINIEELSKFLSLPIKQSYFEDTFNERNNVFDPDEFKCLIDALKRNNLYDFVDSYR